MNFFSFVAESHLSPSQQISWLILHSLWQGLVVALFVFTINTLMWRASAKFRYWIAVVGLLAMIVGVFSTWWMMQPATWVVDATPATWAVASDEIVMPQLTMSDSMDPTVFETVRPSALEKWAPFVALVYLIGVGMMWLRLTLSVIGVNRLRRGSISVEKQLADRVYSLANQIGVRARPALKTCERTVIPFAAGVFRPVILLPTFAISGMTQSELDAIFLHELAHIGRGDLIVNVVQRFAESFFFFNPATWYISRVITTERENCCDDIVLGQCDQSTYASALIRLAESLTGKPEDVAPVVALAATGAKPSQLKRRVQRILGVPPALRNPSVGVVLSCVLVMAIAAVQLHAQSDDEGSSKTGVVLEATDENRDLEIRTPLTVSFDKKGVVSSFTAFSLDSSMSDSAQRDRFNLILKNIQTDNRVVIDTTRVRRKRDGTLAMTVSGKNLKTDAIQNAIRRADAPANEEVLWTLEGTGETKKEMALRRDEAEVEKSILEALHQLELVGSKLGLRYDPEHPSRKLIQRQIQLTRELIREQQEVVRKGKLTALVERERPNLDGPFKMEFVDDSDVFVLRGKKEDVDHIMKLVEQSGLNKTDRKSTKEELEESVENKSDRDYDRHSLRVIQMDVEHRMYDLRFETGLKAVFDGSRNVRVATDARSQKTIVAAPTDVHRQITASLESLDLDQAELAKGKTLYQQHCTHCHGKHGEGNGPTAEFLNPTPRHFASDDYKKVELEAVLLSGIKGTAMPSFQVLAQHERSSLAAYAEFLSMRGRFDNRVGQNNLIHVGRPEGALAFPPETERAMMGDAAAAPEVRMEGEWEVFNPNAGTSPPAKSIPIEIERGMQIDAIEGDVKY